MEEYRKNLEDVGVEPERRFAGFWIRSLATFLDVLVLSSFDLVINAMFGVPLLDPPFWLDLLQTVFNFLYFVIMTRYFGQTLGKMVCGIRVIKENKNEIPLATALLRETLGKILSSIFFIGYIMAAFDSRKRALHDRMAHTYVVKQVQK